MLSATELCRGVQIHSITKEQLGYGLQSVTASDSDWILFAEEGEMKLYRREVEVDGVVMDPCKAMHQVQGVTAHEMAHHFWSSDVRFEWDSESQTHLESYISVFIYMLQKDWDGFFRDRLGRIKSQRFFSKTE